MATKLTIRIAQADPRLPALKRAIAALGFAWQESGQGGAPHRGEPPYGHRRAAEGGLEPDPGEQEVLGRIRGWLAAGRSAGWIGRELRETTSPPRSAAAWHLPYVYQLVARVQKQRGPAIPVGGDPGLAMTEAEVAALAVELNAISALG